MATIYGNAYLTVAATNSAGPDGGLFQPLDENLQERPVPWHLMPPSSPQLWYRRSLDHIHLQESSRLHPTSNWDKFVDPVGYPLLGRAWTFQEHLLSPRVVQFAKRELVWECSRTMWCCCTPDYEPLVGIKRPLAPWFAPQATSASSSNTEEFIAAWKHIVSRYSVKALTYDQDILPALSGMAKRARKAIKLKYLAGIWAEDLPSQLCWLTQAVYEGPKGGIWPENYRAPSWSWASIKGPIRWGNLQKQRGDFHVLEASCTQSDDDPTGRVRGGYIVVEGSVFEGEFEYVGRLPYQNAFRVKRGDISVRFDADVPFNRRPFSALMPNGTPLHCIAIGEVERDSYPVKEYCYVLILRKIKSWPERFARVGISEVIVWRKDWENLFKSAITRKLRVL